MEDLSRRSVLLGGAALVGGAAAATVTAQPAAAAGVGGRYLWALNNVDFTVPNDTWVKIPWNAVLMNTTTARLASDGRTWTFPTRSASGIYQITCNVAWDNATSPTGAAIRPPTHRKLIRILQQNVGNPQQNQIAYLASASESLYHADLALRRDQTHLADGSKGFQQQQVCVQGGGKPTGPDQRIWVEVLQDSGQPLACRTDGSLVHESASHPSIRGMQAPSLMITKICDY